MKEKTKKSEKKSFSNSNLGSCPAKIIKLKWGVLTKRYMKEWRVVQSFWPINERGFSNLNKFYLDQQLTPYIFEGLNIGLSIV